MFLIGTTRNLLLPLALRIFGCPILRIFCEGWERRRRLVLATVCRKLRFRRDKNVIQRCLPFARFIRAMFSV
jgi:hypothetical protein